VRLERDLDDLDDAQSGLALIKSGASQGWLHRIVDERYDQNVCYLTQDAHRALDVLRGMRRQDTIATGGSITGIASRLKQVAVKVDNDPARIRKHIEAENAALNEELDQARCRGDGLGCDDAEAQSVGKEEFGVGQRTCPIGEAARRPDRVGGGNRFFLPAISFITDLLRPGGTIPPVITPAGSRPFGCRPTRAGTDRRTAQSCARRTNRYQETPFIVIRKHRSTSRRRRRPYCTISSRAALWGITRHAERLGTAGMGRNTCANQAPHLRLQSSAFWSPGAAAR
jgi:Protein of unknown function (DUF3375)